MPQFSTKELIYLEDASKLFDSIEKTCQHASSEVSDPQVKSMLHSLSRDHRQWLQSSASLVTQGRMM